MDVPSIAAGGGLLLAGFLLGRLTAPKTRTTLVYPPPSRTATAVAPATSREPGGPAGVDPEVEAYVRAGRKIEAIKRYRELNGIGLKEAKEAVDALEARLAR